MRESHPTLRDLIAAETAVVEALITAEKLRGIGAVFATAAANELARTRRAKADEIRARIGQSAVAA